MKIKTEQEQTEITEKRRFPLCFLRFLLFKSGETASTTLVLGFTVAYAIANELLAVWGPVIVAFT
jgi:hypothetical protein